LAVPHAAHIREHLPAVSEPLYSATIVTSVTVLTAFFVLLFVSFVINVRVLGTLTGFIVSFCIVPFCVVFVLFIFIGHYFWSVNRHYVEFM
jgi:hypothetical protein